MSISSSKEYALREICTALDIDALVRVAPDFAPYQIRGTIKRMWFLASDRQNIAALDRLWVLGQNNPLYRPEDPVSTVRSAIRVNRAESIQWWLDHLPKDIIHKATVQAVAPTENDGGSRMMTQSLLAVARQYPHLLSGEEVRKFNLGFLSFPAREQDVKSLSTLLDFVRPAQLIGPRAEKLPTSPTTAWWERWSSTASFEQIEFWSRQLASRSWTSPDPPNLIKLAILNSNPNLEKMIYQPRDTPYYEAMEEVFSDGDASTPVLAELIYSTPGKLARMLGRVPRLSELVLSFRDQHGSNIFHLLAKYRCLPGNEISPTCLSWSRLENWAKKNAEHLILSPNHAGQTPLDMIARNHREWYTRISRRLLMDISKASHGSEFNSRGRDPRM